MLVTARRPGTTAHIQRAPSQTSRHLVSTQGSISACGQVVRAFHAAMASRSAECTASCRSGASAICSTQHRLLRVDHASHQQLEMDPTVSSEQPLMCSGPSSCRQVQLQPMNARHALPAPTNTGKEWHFGTMLRLWFLGDN